ncbi:MAG TPA: hypothetical protein PKE55_03110 [Kiritimatiellia bacterium]|nr:hypothetical protein [Kiritimatiellia bacterium]
MKSWVVRCGLLTGLLVGMVVFVQPAKGQLSWLGSTYVVLSEDLGSRQWFDAGANTANPDFVGHTFTMTLGQTLHVGGQAQTFAPTVGTVVTMFWRLRQADESGSYTTVVSGNFTLPYRDRSGNNDRWDQHPVPGQTPGSTNHDVNVLSGIGLGTYQFQVWYRAQQGEVTIWDSNGGQNYSATLNVIVGPDVPDSATVTVLPQVPRSGEAITIRYEAGDGPLAEATQVVLYVGRNGWLNPVNLRMAEVEDRVWEVTFTPRRLTGSLQLAFHDDGAGASRIWDNNWSRNWGVRVLPSVSGGEILVAQPMWDGERVRSGDGVRLEGMARGVVGDLHWINDANGMEGWVPAASAWTIPEVPLSDGENVIRVSGTTAGRSPNDGSQDCATNSVYRSAGWRWRQNAGQGFGEWALRTTGGGGFFIADAATTTNLASHSFAWGLFSGSSGEAHAIRQFAEPLSVGEVFRIMFENNGVQSGGSVGITLRDGRDQRMFTFMFEGGRTTYTINDRDTGFDTGIPWTSTGVALSFELTSPTNYRFTANGVEINRSLPEAADGMIRMMRIWNVNAGSGGGRNLYVADMSVTGPDVPPVRIETTRRVHREPGLPLGIRVEGNEVRAELHSSRSGYEYDLEYTTDLGSDAEWIRAEWGVAGDETMKVFSLPGSPGKVFARAVERPVVSWHIDNPYEGVQWDEFEQHKAILHMHTTLSDGGGSPTAVIDRYMELGYSILSITDHDTMGAGNNQSDPNRDRTTWPWEAYGRIPEALNVLAIEGNEISNMSDFGSYFNDYGNGSETNQDVALEEVAARGGLAVMFHPGRYLFRSQPTRTLAWYAQMFRAYDHLVGFEIYNQRNRYPLDEAAWDELLGMLIEERMVWAYSNDDMHSMSSQLGYNWNVFLMPELSEKWMRHAMIEGTFFFVNSPHGHNGPPPPRVHEIRVDRASGVISIEASGHGRIDWISEGQLVHQGNSIDLGSVANLGRYVRAKLIAANSDAVLGTQPFRVAPIP